MRIATFNINGVNKRLANLVAWLRATAPDVVCLQEIKCAQNQFPRFEIEAAGYGAIWHGTGGHHGVAILQKGGEPQEIRRALPGFEEDIEPRFIEAAIDGLLVTCIYAPNGNPWPGPRFAYKLEWMKRFNAYAKTLVRDGIPSVLAGDFNVVPTDGDIYAMRSWLDNALVQPEPRASFAELLGQGWTDAVGDLHPHERVYTFWHYLRESWQRNAGLRIDHLLVAPSLLPRLSAAGVDASVRGESNASDHAPAWIALSPSAPEI